MLQDVVLDSSEVFRDEQAVLSVVICVSAYLSGKTLTVLCSGLSFQGCLYRE